MLADLRQLPSRLKAASVQATGDSTAPFSLVLVGPGLWSHYYLTAQDVQARLHPALRIYTSKTLRADATAQR